MEYTIAAKPTFYKGRKYRSRLEARWAAFFDRMTWKFEYEPVDFGSWSPDFEIIFPTLRLAAEVKPIREFDIRVAEKMATVPTHLLGDRTLLLLGLEPIFSEADIQIGWTALSASSQGRREALSQYQKRVERWNQEASNKPGHKVANSLWNPASLGCTYSVYRTKRLWVESANDVQFLPPS